MLPYRTLPGRRLERHNEAEVARVMSESQQKIFVIGRNKTGTTSMLIALRTLGYKVGSQPAAELLLGDWAKRDFRRIVEYCRSADAFQDVPFSLDFTYVVLDHAFPHSKFILTVRNNAAEWYDSLVRFHTKMIGKDRLPTADDLRQFKYRKPNFLWEAAQFIYGVDENSLYDRDIYMRHYDLHNERVREYFRYRASDLLELNLGDPCAMRTLCGFLGIDPGDKVMPHLNASS